MAPKAHGNPGARYCTAHAAEGQAIYKTQGVEAYRLWKRELNGWEPKAASAPKATKKAAPKAKAEDADVAALIEALRVALA